MIAAEVYDVALDRTSRGPLGRVVAGALDLAAAAVGGLLELSQAGTVVVRRRTDGTDVLSLDGDSAEELAQLAEHLRSQLETMSVEEFAESWGISG